MLQRAAEFPPGERQQYQMYSGVLCAQIQGLQNRSRAPILFALLPHRTTEISPTQETAEQQHPRRTVRPCLLREQFRSKGRLRGRLRSGKFLCAPSHHPTTSIGNIVLALPERYGGGEVMYASQKSPRGKSPTTKGKKFANRLPTATSRRSRSFGRSGPGRLARLSFSEGGDPG